MLHHISLGVRDLQHAGLFYDAFVVDPDGHRVEAVINRPQA
jgi:catechol 2,3-dioxygenase-like lactoylglutathione lyase family enzyme